MSDVFSSVDEKLDRAIAIAQQAKADMSEAKRHLQDAALALQINQGATWSAAIRLRWNQIGNAALAITKKENSGE